MPLTQPISRFSAHLNTAAWACPAAAARFAYLRAAATDAGRAALPLPNMMAVMNMALASPGDRSEAKRYHSNAASSSPSV